jgi:hypothetical protein
MDVPVPIIELFRLPLLALIADQRVEARNLLRETGIGLLELVTLRLKTGNDNVVVRLGLRELLCNASARIVALKLSCARRRPLAC